MKLLNLAEESYKDSKQLQEGKDTKNLLKDLNKESKLTPDGDDVHPIFGPKIKIQEDENANFYTSFLSTCNIKEKMVFLRKVYTIYLIQIILPLILSLVAYNQSVTFFLQNNIWILWVNIGISVLVVLPLLSLPIISKIFPLNYIIMSILSLSIAFIFMILSTIKPVIFLLILSSNVMIVIAFIISTYLYQEEKYPNFILISSLISSVFIYLMIFSLTFQIKLTYVAISLACSILYLLFLILETFIIIVEHSNKYCLEDYVLVSETLYTGIVMVIFYLISKIFEKKDDKTI